MNDEQRKILEFVSVMNIINYTSGVLNPSVRFMRDGSTDLVFPNGEVQNFKTLHEIVELSFAQVSLAGFKRGLNFARDLVLAGKPIPEEGPSEDDYIM